MKLIDVNLAAPDERYGRLRVSDRRLEMQLMASIEEHGQQDAICVAAESEGHFVVVDGALRRYAAGGSSTGCSRGSGSN